MLPQFFSKIDLSLPIQPGLILCPTANDSPRLLHPALVLVLLIGEAQELLGSETPPRPSLPCYHRCIGITRSGDNAWRRSRAS
jgi:hypothetical protein